MTGSIVFLSGLRHHGSLMVGLSRGWAELLFLPLSALEHRPRRIGLAWAPSDTWLKAAREADRSHLGKMGWPRPGILSTWVLR